MSKVVVTFDEDQENESVGVDIITRDEGCTHKRIAFKTLLENLAVCTEVHSEKKFIGKLPYGFVDGYIGDTSEDSLGVILDIPKGKRSLFYRENNKEWKGIVDYPRLLFALSVEKGRYVCKRCFALHENDELNEHTKMYRFPFSNVSCKGNICVGGAQFKKVHNFLDVEEFVESFFQSTYNGDYYDTGFTKAYMSFVDLLESIKQRFPDEILVETEYNYKDVLEELAQ